MKKWKGFFISLLLLSDYNNWLFNCSCFFILAVFFDLQFISIYYCSFWFVSFDITDVFTWNTSTNNWCSWLVTIRSYYECKFIAHDTDLSRSRLLDLSSLRLLRTGSRKSWAVIWGEGWICRFISCLRSHLFFQLMVRHNYRLKKKMHRLNQRIRRNKNDLRRWMPNGTAAFCLY
jgi:hypothetical protein